MIFLQEYLILRTELGRELTHLELDRNFLFVSNPWNSDRNYTEGMVVYYGEETTAGVGPLSWYRANQDIQPEILFDFAKWDPIGQSAASGNIIVKDGGGIFNAVSTIEFTNDFNVLFSGSVATISLSTSGNIWQPEISDPNTIYYNNPVLVGTSTIINPLYKFTVAGHQLITGNLQVNGNINGINLNTFYNNFNLHSHTIVGNTLPGYNILYPNSNGQLLDTNINIGTLATGNVLSWDSGTNKWINTVAPGGLHALGTHTDVATSVSLTPINNQILRYNSISTKWENITVITDNTNGFSTAPFLHNHDNKYWTKTQLSNTTGAIINWTNIFGTPALPSNADTYVVLSASGNLTNERVLTAGNGINILDNGANNSVVISTINNTSNQKVIIQRNGTTIGTRPIINFIEPFGGDLTITAVDDSLNQRVNITLSATFTAPVAPVTSVNTFIGAVSLGLADLNDTVIVPGLFPGPGSGTPYSPLTNILVFDDDINSWTNIPINTLVAQISGLYLDDLLDVTVPLSGISDKDLLYYDSFSNNWISGAAADANLYTITDLNNGALNTLYYTKAELLTNIVEPKIHWKKIFGVPSFAAASHSHYLYQILDVVPYSTPSLITGDILVWDSGTQLWTPSSTGGAGGKIIANSTIPGTFTNTANQLITPTVAKPLRYEAGTAIKIESDITEHIIKTSVLVDNISIGINTAGELEFLGIIPTSCFEETITTLLANTPYVLPHYFADDKLFVEIYDSNGYIISLTTKVTSTDITVESAVTLYNINIIATLCGGGGYGNDGASIISNSTISGIFNNSGDQVLIPSVSNPIKFKAGDGIEIYTDTNNNIVKTNVLVDNITIGINSAGELESIDFQEDIILYHILSTETITIKDRREYFVYGDLKIDGTLNIDSGGKLVIYGGVIDLSGGGLVNNAGMIIYIAEPSLQSVTNEDNTTNNDIEITDPTKGIILTSPDLSRWRITVDNLGNLITTSI